MPATATSASEGLCGLLPGLLTLFLLAVAFMLMLFGPAGTRRALRAGSRLLGKALFRVLLFTVGGLLLITATAIDAVITTALTTYQAATGRPYLAGDSWAAFAQRLNDRLLKILWH